MKMAGRRRGAGPLWALGGAALGLCLAGVAGQLVEVRLGGAWGLGVAGASPGGGWGAPFWPGAAFSLPFALEDLA